MREALLHSCIYFTYYIIGAYATTDILRLLKGSSFPVSDSSCFCPQCGQKLLLRDQLPIISYLLNCGKCRYCRTEIPVLDIFLEIYLFFTLSVITKFLDYGWNAYFLCVVIYETTKGLCILRFGKREEEFNKNLVISLGNNLLIFSLMAILFVIQTVVLS